MHRSTAALFSLTLVTTFSLSACDADDSNDGGDAGNDRVASVDGEVAEHASNHATKAMSKLDGDQDGKITKTEAQGSPLESHFEKVDLDASGDVDSDELNEFMSVMAEKHHGEGHGCGGHGEGHDGKDCAAHECGGHGEGQGCPGHKAHGEGEGHSCAGGEGCEGGCEHGKHGKHGKMGKMDPEAHADYKIEKYDSDGDGAISRDEAGESRFAEHFDMLDSDGDGNISREEIVTHAEERKGHHGKAHHGKAHHGKAHHGDAHHAKTHAE